MEKHDLMNLPPWEMLLKKILWKQLGDISGKRILDFGSGIGVMDCVSLYSTQESQQVRP